MKILLNMKMKTKMQQSRQFGKLAKTAEEYSQNTSIHGVKYLSTASQVYFFFVICDRDECTYIP